MKRAATLAAAILAGACATPDAPARKPPSVPYNLSGYPAPFREGFALGCDAARRGVPASERAPQRTPPDPQFRMGWQDGLSACRPKK
jgi:hypothetical protein